VLQHRSAQTPEFWGCVLLFKAAGAGREGCDWPWGTPGGPQAAAARLTGRRTADRTSALGGPKSALCRKIYAATSPVAARETSQGFRRAAVGVVSPRHSTAAAAPACTLPARCPHPSRRQGSAPTPRCAAASLTRSGTALPPWRAGPAS